MTLAKLKSNTAFALGLLAGLAATAALYSLFVAAYSPVSTETAPPYFAKQVPEDGGLAGVESLAHSSPMAIERYEPLLAFAPADIRQVCFLPVGPSAEPKAGYRLDISLTSGARERLVDTLVSNAGNRVRVRLGSWLMGDHMAGPDAADRFRVAGTPERPDFSFTFSKFHYPDAGMAAAYLAGTSTDALTRCEN